MLMFEKLKSLAARLDELEMRLSEPGLYDDPDRAAKLLKERNELEPIVAAFRAYGAAQQAQREALELLSDPDMKELAQGYGEEYAEKAVDFCIITNDYHLARACRLMRRSTGLTPSGIPAPTPYPGQWVSVRCREYCSILGLMLTGRWW